MRGDVLSIVLFENEFTKKYYRQGYDLHGNLEIKSNNLGVEKHRIYLLLFKDDSSIVQIEG